jgi:hypothetical protein
MYQTSERAKRHGDELGHVKQVHRPRDADELGDHVGVVHHHQHHHQHKGEPQSKLLADQVAQSLAGDHAHAGAHLLHHDQRNGDGKHGPQQRVAVLRACLGVSEDAAGVVIDVGGNKSGAENGQKQQYPDSPTLPHARGVLRWIHLQVSSMNITGKPIVRRVVCIDKERPTHLQRLRRNSRRI